MAVNDSMEVWQSGMKLKILGIKGMTFDEVKAEVDRGGVFVVYEYCISVILFTFRRPSEVYFIKKGSNRYTPGLTLSFVSLVLGWWGFPWGPIYTIKSVLKNLAGGRNVTGDVMASIRPPQKDVNPPLPTRPPTPSPRSEIPWKKKLSDQALNAEEELSTAPQQADE